MPPLEHASQAPRCLYSIDRSSRSATACSRSHKSSVLSPPPILPDAIEFTEDPRNGQDKAFDLLRMTPKLHASLVSEILSLRRALQSTGHLVEDLKTRLATAKEENEHLRQQLAASAKEALTKKRQIQQVQNSAYEALEAVAKGRTAKSATTEEIKGQLHATRTPERRQRDDVARSQSVLKRVEDKGEDERRQLERRTHISETRMRTLIDEMKGQPVNNELPGTQLRHSSDKGSFKDSRFSSGSDTGIASSKFGKHKRNVSGTHFISRKIIRNLKSMRTTTGTRDLLERAGSYSLADELGIDMEDGFGMGNSNHADNALNQPEGVERVSCDINLQQGSFTSDTALKAKVVLGLLENTPRLARRRESVTRSSEESTAARSMHEIATPAAETLIPAIPEVASGITIESVQSAEAGSRDPSTHTVAMTMTACPVSVLVRKSSPASSSLPSPTLKSLADTPRPQLSHDSNIKGFRSMHLKAIPLPNPVLAPANAVNDVRVQKSHSPLNRPSQFGVTLQTEELRARW